MTDNDPTRGIELDKQPHKSIIKRIDIGLTTGMCALLLSFIGILTSRATFKMNQKTQKVRVLPIIDIDLGYVRKLDEKGAMKRYFEVTLNNVGAGIAHIQSVTPTQNGKPLETYQAFEDTAMTRRMRSWTTMTEGPSTGYLRAGESITPRSYKFGASESEVSAYLRGQWGVPLDGVDLAVCYCSVFDDCWTVKYLDRKQPKPVNSCGVTDVTNDMFQNYIDEAAAARLKDNNEASE